MNEDKNLKILVRELSESYNHNDNGSLLVPLHETTCIAVDKLTEYIKLNY